MSRHLAAAQTGQGSDGTKTSPAINRRALRLITAFDTVQSPLRWADDAGWKRDYSNAELLAPAELERLRAEAEQARLTARAMRQDEIKR